MNVFRPWIHAIRSKRACGFFLAAPSFLFSTLVRLRHRLYDWRILPQKFSKVCVVSIGNLVAGGVGKTQLVHFLTHQLHEKKRVAILSRGYKGQAEKAKEPLLVKTSLHPPELCGDEPWLLASRLQEASIIVCKDRARAAKVAESLEAKVILLDDGMQHRRLHRDFEIVVIDAKDPFGGSRFLPWGNLREDPKRLCKADLLVTFGTLSKEDEKRLRMLTAAQIVEMQIRVKKVTLFSGEEICSLKGKKIGVFCGIGNPERFLSTVQELGAEVIASHFLSDHKKIKEKELLTFADVSKEKGGELLLCTEKDKVKLSNKTPCPIPMGWVQTELEVSKNHGAWEKIVGEIKQLAGISS